MKRHRLYFVWAGLKSRCNNPKIKGYSNYGGRGIRVSERWQKFENFVEDMFVDYLEHCSKYGEKNTTLDRINTNGNYCKENSQWATMKEQQNNRRNNTIVEYNGEKKTLAQWSDSLRMKQTTLGQRIYVYKWPMKECLETPVRKRSKNNG